METLEDLNFKERVLRYKKFKAKKMKMAKRYNTPKNYSIWVSLIMINFLNSRVKK
jgi:hypothetical protein